MRKQVDRCNTVYTGNQQGLINIYIYIYHTDPKDVNVNSAEIPTAMINRNWNMTFFQL